MKLNRRTQWPETYRRGSHCFSTMIANVLVDTGFDVDEELCYVIGSGLGLLFYRDGDTYYANSRMHDLERFFARHVGARIDYMSHPSADAMLQRAREWSQEGTLPFLYCEARELSSFRSVLPWDKVHPVGEHALPVRSVTDSGDVICSDYLWSHSFVVAYDEVVTATSMPSDGALSMACPSPKFAVGRLVPPRDVPDIREVLAVSLAENAEVFLHPANNTQGERALKALERELASMPDVLEVDRLRSELVSMSTMFERIGSGGGAGRHLFGRGVRASAGLLGSQELSKLADAYARLGGRWRTFSRQMQQHSTAADPREGWQGLVLAMREIRKGEVEAVNKLALVANAALGGGA